MKLQVKCPHCKQTTSGFIVGVTIAPPKIFPIDMVCNHCNKQFERVLVILKPGAILSFILRIFSNDKQPQ